ncbi:MAG TPA: hypothetical protein VK590_05940 [Saprospiraceae bacterium]|nr:hypothetical protein [Saprospiraceae bacterium]
MKEKEQAEKRLTLLFEGQKLELRSGFVGGWLSDEINAPMGMYTGTNSLEETSVALVHLLRAVTKMYVDEHNMDYRQAKSLLDFAVKEAIKTEENFNPEDNISLEQHEALLKIKRDYRRR